MAVRKQPQGWLDTQPDNLLWDTEEWEPAPQDRNLICCSIQVTAKQSLWSSSSGKGKLWEESAAADWWVKAGKLFSTVSSWKPGMPTRVIKRHILLQNPLLRRTLNKIALLGFHGCWADGHAGQCGGPSLLSASNALGGKLLANVYPFPN